MREALELVTRIVTREEAGEVVGLLRRVAQGERVPELEGAPLGDGDVVTVLEDEARPCLTESEAGAR